MALLNPILSCLARRFSVQWVKMRFFIFTKNSRSIQMINNNFVYKAFSGKDGQCLKDSWLKILDLIRSSMCEGIGRERQMYLKRTIAFPEYLKILDQWQQVLNLLVILSDYTVVLNKTNISNITFYTFNIIHLGHLKFLLKIKRQGITNAGMLLYTGFIKSYEKMCAEGMSITMHIMLEVLLFSGLTKFCR